MLAEDAVKLVSSNVSMACAASFVMCSGIVPHVLGTVRMHESSSVRMRASCLCTLVTLSKGASEAVAYGIVALLPAWTRSRHRGTDMCPLRLHAQGSRRFQGRCRSTIFPLGRFCCTSVCNNTALILRQPGAAVIHCMAFQPRPASRLCCSRRGTGTDLWIQASRHAPPRLAVSR